MSQNDTPSPVPYDGNRDMPLYGVDWEHTRLDGVSGTHLVYANTSDEALQRATSSRLWKDERNIIDVYLL